MAQIKAYIKLNKQGVIEYEEQYFNIEVTDDNKLQIQVPSVYEPIGIPKGDAYKWAPDLTNVCRGVSSIKDVQNFALCTTLEEHSNPYVTNVDNMFRGASNLETYTFFGENIVGFNNTYRETSNMKSYVEIDNHVKYLDNCFAYSGLRRADIIGTPVNMSNCFYGASDLAAVYFHNDFVPTDYSHMLDTLKSNRNRLDLYMPGWDTTDEVETNLNNEIKFDPDGFFGYPCTWDFETARNFGIYYNRQYQIYVHYGLPKPTTRKGIFLNPTNNASIINAYRNYNVTDLV